jgi:hypothetical protein
MTIWLLAILLLACSAAAGYRQGAIRAGISFFGILLALLFAGLLGKLVAPLLKLLGVTNPVLLWALPPFVAFAVVLAAIKIAGQMVHQKVDVYYKYKGGDLRLALWERLNARTGACIAMLNGLLYLILLSFVIHALSYWSVQMASSEGDPKTMRLVNQLGRDLQSTGMARVGRAVYALPEAYYETADLAGLLFQNPLLEARLLRYPGFLSLGERDEFQALGQDTTFQQMRLKQTPLKEVLEYPGAKTIFDNPDLLRQIWATVQPDLKDLQEFLRTGRSAKYDSERLLGRWHFDANASVLMYRRAKPSLSAPEAARVRAWLAEKFSKGSVVAGPDHGVVLKNFPLVRLQPGQPLAGDAKTLKGEWKPEGTGYEFTLDGGTDKRTARFEGSRLVVSGDGGTPIAFAHEE